MNSKSSYPSPPPTRAAIARKSSIDAILDEDDRKKPYVSESAMLGDFLRNTGPAEPAKPEERKKKKGSLFGWGKNLKVDGASNPEMHVDSSKLKASHPNGFEYRRPEHLHQPQVQNNRLNPIDRQLSQLEPRFVTPNSTDRLTFNHNSDLQQAYLQIPKPLLKNCHGAPSEARAGRQDPRMLAPFQNEHRATPPFQQNGCIQPNLNDIRSIANQPKDFQIDANQNVYSQNNLQVPLEGQKSLKKLPIVPERLPRFSLDSAFAPLDIITENFESQSISTDSNEDEVCRNTEHNSYLDDLGTYYQEDEIVTAEKLIKVRFNPLVQLIHISEEEDNDEYSDDDEYVNGIQRLQNLNVNQPTPAIVPRGSSLSYVNNNEYTIVNSRQSVQEESLQSPRSPKSPVSQNGAMFVNVNKIVPQQQSQLSPRSSVADGQYQNRRLSAMVQSPMEIVSPKPLPIVSDKVSVPLVLVTDESRDAKIEKNANPEIIAASVAKMPNTPEVKIKAGVDLDVENTKLKKRIVELEADLLSVQGSKEFSDYELERQQFEVDASATQVEDLRAAMQSQQKKFDVMNQAASKRIKDLLLVQQKLAVEVKELKTNLAG